MGIFGGTYQNLPSAPSPKAVAFVYPSLEARVAELEAIVASLQAGAARDHPDWGVAVAAAPPPSGAPSWELEVRRLAASGKKIEAIKEVRAATGWGLKESKDYVDRL